MFLGTTNGLELLKTYKKNSPDTQVIIITAFDLIEQASEIIKIGINNYLHKPILKEDLLRTVKKASQTYIGILTKSHALTNFFIPNLSIDEKCCLLEIMYQYKKSIKQSFTSSDIAVLFPNISTHDIKSHFSTKTPTTKKTLLPIISQLTTPTSA